MEHWAAIIENAAKSPAGIVALITIVIGGIALAFFKNDGPNIKLGVFGVLVVGAGLAVYAVFSQFSSQIRAEDLPVSSQLSPPVGTTSNQPTDTPNTNNPNLSQEELDFLNSSKTFLRKWDNDQ